MRNPGSRVRGKEPRQPSASLPSAASREPSQALKSTVSFSQKGGTCFLDYGNTATDAMPDGVGKPAQYDIDVSIGDGVD